MAAEGLLEPYELRDIAGRPPAAIIYDYRLALYLRTFPAVAEYATHHYIPLYRNLWIPGLAALVPARPTHLVWTAPRAGTYDSWPSEVLATHPWFTTPLQYAAIEGLYAPDYVIPLRQLPPMPAEAFQWTVDGVAQPRGTRTLVLRRGSRVELRTALPRNAGVLLVPRGSGDALHRHGGGESFLMKILILSEEDVTHLLAMGPCIEVMAEALAALARGEVHNPLRQIVRGPGAPGMLGLMPAWRSRAASYYALKEVCVFPENPKRGLDTHLGAVILHSGETGEPLAFMNASAITAIRTAAVSAVATRLLGRPDASVLAIIGSGVQARSHLQALRLVREIRDVRIYGRDRVKAQAWVDGLGTQHGTVRLMDSVEAAVRAPTSSSPPRARGSRSCGASGLRPALTSMRSARASPLHASSTARPWRPHRCSSTVANRPVNESGDYLFALQEKAIGGPEHIRAELGEILIGTAAGRTSADEITLFKSLGLAIEDLAAASFLYEAARREQRGSWVEF